MAMPDPWSLAQKFIDELNNQAEKNRYYSNQASNNMYGAMIDRQDAATLAQAKIQADQVNYSQDLQRDEYRRMFEHGENQARNVAEYGGKASKSRFGAGGVAAPEITPYVSPMSPQQVVSQPPGTGGASVQPVSAPMQPQPQQQTDTGPEPELSQRGAYNYYIQQGMPAVVAAGIVANMDAESGFDPNVWSGARRGDSGSAGYAGQWRGSRLANLENYARSRGHDRPTVKDQLDFYVYEGTSGSDEGARRAFQLAAQAQTPEDAATIIMQNFERPSADPRENQIGHRQRVARSIFDTQGGSSGGGQPATDQRRYPSTVQAQPDTASGNPSPAFPVKTSGPAAADDSSIQDDDHIWTDEEMSQYLAPDEIAAIKSGNNQIKGPPRMYSEAQMSKLPTEIADSLMPVYKKDQYGPSEYLYLQPAAPEHTDDGLVAPEAKPQITSAPPVEITKSNPKDPKATESTRTVNGEFQTKVGNRWVTMGKE